MLLSVWAQVQIPADMMHSVGTGRQRENWKQKLICNVYYLFEIRKESSRGEFN